jgi:hypothetical protein
MLAFILGIPFGIEVTDSPKGFIDGQVGAVDVQQGQIILEEDASPWELRETCLHEIIHAIDIKLHLKLKEAQVKALSAVLYDVFTDKDNKKLVEWICNV